VDGVSRAWLLAGTIRREATFAVVDIALITTPALLAKFKPSDRIAERAALSNACVDGVVVRPCDFVWKISDVVIFGVATGVVPGGIQSSFLDGRDGKDVKGRVGGVDRKSSTTTTSLGAVSRTSHYKQERVSLENESEA
jgi:hypothetical protein